MQVSEHPFSTAGYGNITRPYLPITIINPDTDKRIKVFALIDTGSDECALPASFAPILGHDIQAGREKKLSTGNGVTTAYSHTTRIELEGFTTNDLLMDSMPKLTIPILGVNSFLSNFILTVDCPNKTFSLQLP